MKKTLVIVMALVMALSIVVGLASCAGNNTATAYGLVHSLDTIGIATVKVEDGKITEVTLDEAQLPQAVRATAEAGEYAVQNGNNYYWKTVKYGNVTMTYVVTDDYKGYKVGDQTHLEYFASADNCKAYVEAVKANKITVVTADGNKTDVMNADNLLKSNNGYWTVNETSAQLGWKANAAATCAYVLENGFDGVTATKAEWKAIATTNENAEANPKLDNEAVDANGVATGATWSDMWDYLNLLRTAYNTLVK